MSDLTAYIVGLIVLTGITLLGLEATRIFGKRSLPLGLMILAVTIFTTYTSYDILRDVLNPSLTENEKSAQILVAMLVIFPLMLGVAMWFGIKLYLADRLSSAKMLLYSLIASLTIALIFVGMLPYIGIK